MTWVTTVDRSTTRARISLTLVFFLHATVFASWTPHIGDLRRRLGISEAELGVALMGEPLGSFALMLLAGAIIVRLGSGRVLRWSLRAFAVTTVMIGLSGSLLSLFLLLALWGGVLGTLNIAMNTQAVTVEKKHRQPIMSSFHAAWSLGAFAGSALGSLGNSTSLPLVLQLAITAILALAVIESVNRWFLPQADEEAPTAPRFARPTRPLLVLSLIAICGLFSEGAAVAWSSVYFRDVLAVGPGLVGLGYGAYSLSMFIGRVVGDRIVRFFGPVVTIRTLTGLACGGFTMALLSRDLVVATLGFALLGLGLACVMPLVIRAAGALSGVSTPAAVAAVSTSGWFGVVLGPPLIGIVASALSLTTALALVVVLTGVVFSLAPAVRSAHR